MTAPRHSKIIVLGSGPAGYTAAIYAARALRKPTLIAGIQPGGQLTITTDVENYPGFADVIQGPWLMDQMRAQAIHVGTQMVEDHIIKADLKKKPFTLTGDTGQLYTCDVLIIATGAQAKWLGLPSEQKFKGFGVSACATCDAFFYRNKEVLVVGGGNTAVEEALHLTHFASKVTVVHRREKFRAEKILQDRLFNNPKVKVIWDTELADVIGGEAPLSVTTARLRNCSTGGETEVPVHGVFIAQPCSRHKSVLLMEFKGVFLREYPCDATLRPTAVGVCAGLLGEDGDRAMRRHRERVGQPCQPTPNH